MNAWIGAGNSLSFRLFGGHFHVDERDLAGTDAAARQRATTICSTISFRLRRLAGGCHELGQQLVEFIFALAGENDSADGRQAVLDAVPRRFRAGFRRSGALDFAPLIRPVSDFNFEVIEKKCQESDRCACYEF